MIARMAGYMMHRIVAQRGIQIVSNLDEYITPVDGVVEDSIIKPEEQIPGGIIEAYNEGNEEDDKGEDPDLTYGKITLGQVIAAMQVRMKLGAV